MRLGFLDTLIGYHLRRAQVGLFQHFARTVGRAGVTPGQLGVVAMIGANPGLSQTGLGRALGIDRSTMVALIDALEERGLVVREVSPNDRRSHALRLSSKGTELLGRLEEAARAHESDWAGALSAAERRQLIELLRRLAAE
ncbi:MAG TPA: MarR family transcriptional regulator [Stellaceae bacterium]|nr:MarR family transcriptional regulator [Stellaceae bacterium]